MTLEIERKFLCNLTKEEAIELSFASRHVKSIYLENTPLTSFRVVKDTSEQNIKSCKFTRKESTNSTLSRLEFEEEIPEIIFNAIDNGTYPSVSKYRYLINVNGSIWEVDFFDDYDFVIAELEFNSTEEAADFTDLPSWIVEEVTHDPTYLNCNLARM